MGTHTAPVNRAGSNASDTSVALAFSWAVSAGTGSNPVNAADFPGGTFPSGTGTIPAGSASATITFQSNPDAMFEQDETGILTLTTTQSGITVTGSPQPFTITNDDADPGSGGTNVFGPTATSDTGYRQTNSQRHTITGTMGDVNPCNLWLASNADGSEAILFEYVGFGNYNISSVTGGSKSAITSGQVDLSAQPTFQFIRQAGGFKLLVGGTQITEQPENTKTGTYARAQIAGSPTITITAQA